MRPEPTIDLSTPRRTSPLGALLAVFGIEQLRPLLPIVFIAASSGRFLLVLGGGLVVGVLYNAASWWRRTWWYADGVLHLDEGVVVHNQRRIPVERIQHVELEQRLRHQLFGLSVVRVETAGGSEAELSLDAVTQREAEALRAGVATVSTSASSGAVGAAAPEVLVRLPPARLLLAGVTGPEVAAVLAALAVGFDLLADLGLDPDAFGRVEATVLTTAVLVVVAVPLWLFVAGLIGVARRWDLTATIRGDELRVTYGLFRKAEFTVDLSRVQDVRVAHRLLLRPFGRADIRVRTAASGGGDHSRVDIPLLDRAEIEHVLARVVPAALPLPELVPAPHGARRRAGVRGIVAGTAVGALVALTLWSTGAMAVIVVPLCTAVGLACGEAYYRGLGVGSTGDGRVLHSRSGAFTRHHAIVPVERLQSTAVASSWFQRRRQLATVRLDLAGASVAIADRSDPEAGDLAATALSA